MVETMPVLRRSTIVRSSPADLDAVAEQFADKYLGLALMEAAG